MNARQILIAIFVAGCCSASIAGCIRGNDPEPTGTATEVKAASQAKGDDPSMKTTAFAPAKPKLSRAGFDVTPLAQSKIDSLATKLSPEDAKVILKKGTEAPFCGNLLDNKKEGAYYCKLCGLPLFSSSHKFNSGTGWPSFFQPYDKDHIRYEKDTSHGWDRVEIMCSRCGGHLGHVFEDGPKPTGLRFCLNSASLDFHEKGEKLPAESTPIKMETAYFAGGCFWGVEDRFQQTPGVINAVSGYMGGKTKNPSYEDVCRHDTGHAETVKIDFDPAKISYKQLLEKFFKYHDPTQLNRQGPDIGDSYRSAIFTTSAEQAAAVKTFIEEQSKLDRFKSRKIVTQVQEAEKAGPFYEAELYHQDYHERHGGSCPIPTE